MNRKLIFTLVIMDIVMLGGIIISLLLLMLGIFLPILTISSLKRFMPFEWLILDILGVLIFFLPVAEFKFLGAFPLACGISVPVLRRLEGGKHE